MTSRRIDRNIRTFRVLVPVWGEDYVARFCRTSLPALLAGGNLPTLARAGDCELIILTTRATAGTITRDRALAAVGAVCPHSFIFIDDLLGFEEYGVILSVAYGRGIASLGRRQQTTAFFFLNADFVISDGLFRTVLDRVRQGFRAVLAPSLRCIDDQVRPQLEREAEVSINLSLTPGELVRLALDNLHPTAVASIVNEGERRSQTANQFLWRVDDSTLLGRYFLMFMLCIQPEKPFEQVTGWCDYALIPELVPSRHFDIVSNSDDGFILELQDRHGEGDSLADGRLEPSDYAPRLSYWTTQEHRRFAQGEILFSAGPLPDLDFARVGFETFMSALSSSLSSTATSHRDHPYWVSSIARQSHLYPSGLPPEFRAVRSQWHSLARWMGIRGR